MLTLVDDLCEDLFLKFSSRMRLTKLDKKSFVNSHAGGMAVAQPNSFEIDFVRNPISESAT